MHAATLLLASAAVLAIGTQAQTKGIEGQIAALDSADSYCFFLPPMLGGDIAANEDKAIAFCNKPNSRAPGAKVFPEGFVLSAHWATGPGWVQVTGQIDPAKYELNPCDAGGQYDIKAPVGASCAGFNHFVNVIEPEIGVYGMRCCNEKTDCDVTHSEYGVKRIFGEQHDFSGPRPDGPLPLALQCVNGKLPDGITTTAPSTVPTTTSSTPTTTGTSPPAQKTTAPATNTTAPPANNDTKSGNDTKTTPSAASSNSVMLAATTVLVAVIGLVIA